MTPRPSRRPVLAGLIVGIAAGVLGLHWGDALLVGLVAGVFTAVFVLSGAGEPDRWPPARLDATSGTRVEVSVLTWSFIGRDGSVSEAAVRRLRSDATRRLAQGGIVIPGGLGASTRNAPLVDGDVRERARAELGDRAWAILTAPGGWMPSLVDIAHCVDVVERLGPEPTPSPTRGLT